MAPDSVAGPVSATAERVEVLVCDVTIDGATMAARRPRFTVTRAGNVATYNDPAYRRELERLGWLLQAGRKIRQPTSGDVVVELLFDRPDRRAVDIDNLVKTILDAATGVLWVDDRQVVGLHARRRLGRGDRARTVVRVKVAQRGAFD